MPSLVLGLVGLKRSGKDTFAQRLVEAHGYTRVAFADPLKDAALQLNPLVRVEHDEAGPLREALGGVQIFQPGEVYRLARIVDEVGWEAAKEVREIRRTLQELGVSIRDNVDRDAWIEAAKARVDATPGPVVITDVRFRNELEYLASHPDGFSVRIIRPGQELTDLHVSEVELLEAHVDEEILNDSTVQALHEKADRAARTLSRWV